MFQGRFLRLPGSRRTPLALLSGPRARPMEMIRLSAIAVTATWLWCTICWQLVEDRVRLLFFDGMRWIGVCRFTGFAKLSCIGKAWRSWTSTRPRYGSKSSVTLRWTERGLPVPFPCFVDRLLGAFRKSMARVFCSSCFSCCCSPRYPGPRRRPPPRSALGGRAAVCWRLCHWEGRNGRVDRPFEVWR